MLALISCQQELEDRYLSPDKNTAAGIDKLFTRMLDDNRVRPSYWEISTIVNWHIGVYAQTVGYLNNEYVYQQNEQYIQERWNDFYRPSSNGAGVLAHYREMERTYNSLSDIDKGPWEIFMLAGKITLLDHAADMVDLWGDIPFKEAGMLNSTGELVYPKFDDGAAVYSVAIDELGEVAALLGRQHYSENTKKLFVQQDILLHGNIQAWQRYANALRLRLLMRISGVDEAKAKTTVLTMLSDKTQYPLPGIDSYVPGNDDVLLTPLVNYTDDLHAAFTDWTNYPAPYHLLENVLKPSNDPRIPVMFDKYGSSNGSVFIPNSEYWSMPWDDTRIEQESNLGQYAILDSTTFLFNNQLPGVVVTTAEVDFLRAEAFERWGGGDPELAYTQGLRHSIQFYYYLNSLNKFAAKPLKVPADEVIDAFLENEFVDYKGTRSEKLAKIWTQKWAHFGFLQAIDGWSEMRRTNYPRLQFLPSSLSGFELPPSRLDYPVSEKTYNPNYSAVEGRDTRSGKIFWDVD